MLQEEGQEGKRWRGWDLGRWPALMQTLAPDLYSLLCNSDEEMRVLRGEQEVDENNLRLPDLDEEDEDEEEDEDDLDGDDFGDQGPRGGGGMVGGMGQSALRRPGGPSADGGGRRVSA